MDSLRVLIVDDEVGMRMAVNRALEKFTVSVPDVDDEVSFVVDEAATGEEAVEKITADPPHIILLDYKLPGISGLEVLEHIDTEKQNILVIMITAYASLETAVTATKRGAYDFLAKPFTPAELKNTIKKASGRLVLLRQAKKLAEEKRKIRFQFTTVLVHELKAPLAAIEGYLQILQGHTLGDSVDTYDNVIRRCMVRLTGMRKMVIDLLDLTRIESGEKRREFSTVDVSALAETSIETAIPEARDRNIDIRLARNDHVTMNADRDEIEIILNNLVTNAVKYNRDNGSVDISIVREGDDVKIVVSDTGIGMTKEESAKLFNDFVRIKNAKTRTILGSGLGLSTVKKIALLYGGDVSVESEPDVGSTFTAVLKEPDFTPVVNADLSSSGAEAD